MIRDDRDSDVVLADRLVSYADALTALAFVGVSGLGLAVADPEIRADIAIVADWLVLSNLLSGAALCAVVVLFRRWELDLRSKAKDSAKVQRYSQLLHTARLVVIWFASGQATVMMLAIR